MLVRMAHWKCSPGYWGADRELFEGAAVPIMLGHDGFVQAMLLAVPGGAERIAFTVWRDAEAYDRFCRSPDLAKITGLFAHMYADGAPPAPVDYEVRAFGAARAPE